MRLWKAVVVTLAFMSVDICVTTAIYVFSHLDRSLLEDIRHFNIFDSVLDLWAACLYRSCLLLGATIGVAKNSALGPRRLRASWLVITLVCLFVGIYAMVKLLLFSEVRRPIRDPWFWALFVWTYISLGASFLLWWLLSTVRPSTQALEPGAATEAEGFPGSGLPPPEQASGATLQKLLSYTKPDVAFLVAASFFLIVAALDVPEAALPPPGETFLPYYTGRAIDGIVIQKSMDQFSTAVTIVCLLAIGSSFAAGIRGGIFTLIFARLNIRLRNCLFRSLVSQETSFFDENRTGDLISRLTSDTTMVSDLVSQNINVFLRNTVKVTGVVVFMFSLSWQLSLVTFMGFPIIMMVSNIYGKYYKRLSKEVQNALARASNTAEETISAMKTVRSFANEEEEAEVYLRKLQQVYKLNRKEAAAYMYYVWGSGLTLLVVQVSILYYGGHLVISGQMTSGNLIAFIIYEFVLGDCMESVGSVYSGLMQGVGAAEKVFEFIDRQPTMVHDGSLAPDHLEGRVDFENVTFTYRTRPHTQVLQNVSFSLCPGKVTALVGPSGSGKSSCVNILENFYPLEGGRVLLDGKPISAYDHKYLHRVISLVSQEPVLFARSITDNISYGLPAVPFEMVVEAAQKANAHGFIMELQDGYSTETGEKGAQLSGGQKQRVAMARALVRNPPVLILDEATSALDAESEYLIQQAIHGNLQKHTVLIIAHRLSTVEHAHLIVVLDKGRVVQQGTHQQLLAQGGLYAKLVQRQMLGLEPAVDFTAGHKEPAANGSHKA
ncbi:PREDICTED: ATP-binding cassette sub-family B member 9 isoform X1 [Cercocebus atys]|uniref:ATP-binding cassette sub-family B member 9 isoform X1 n=1 Tax=Cercocebus atys TaxID=9531 RepID=UPI0005F50DE0|nr:PREDICTED: ATP-binding cassette sub-family B member 9 isoform X1 [Cercocebus atys]XP_011926699.1 PREDICTED: ATP-binding cassette sub-family B member 9 isoform X1 [Cercocebus atys]XP_011926700.1 PREDICTED: ATP-binding cassette sub-family B member 9 isoform X1 [Cercocebus atys]XP_011926701.1 PREDICTED: ATP-binding cassette sub-family B member 9 isoform X1 [Cercocebus atys]XP_011926702.1 PREDICTED: ATP-binding cassette sub-family B member 9 isoform X1 [Cercocebus atys]XP_011926703.1 PREDICTED: